MAKQSAPRPGTSLSKGPRHAGMTSRAQAEMEAKALAGPTENKALDATPTTKKAKPPVKAAKKAKR